MYSCSLLSLFLLLSPKLHCFSLSSFPPYLSPLLFKSFHIAPRQFSLYMWSFFQECHFSKRSNLSFKHKIKLKQSLLSEDFTSPLLPICHICRVSFYKYVVTLYKIYFIQRICLIHF